MKPPVSAPRQPQRIGRPTKCISLLIGLPLLLHVLLWMTQSSLGGWPAVITTLVLGVGLSFVFNTDGQPVEAEVEPDVVPAGV